MHDMGRAHPESPERLDAISDQLLASGMINLLRAVDTVVPVSHEALSRVHSGDYLARLEKVSPVTGTYRIDADTAMNPHTLSAAKYAAGALVQAVDAVMAGQSTTAFCAVRPPGHHATRGQAMGFCFFNNIAVAAAHALAEHGLKRVAIIDFDVHHGNGTESIFSGDERVLMCGFFQHPLYPNCGLDNPASNMVNVPVPAYTTGSTIRELVSGHWLPRLEAHAPEMVFVSAGFDGHREDDMAQLALVESDYAWLTQQIVAVAERHAQNRVVSALEGGYNLSALARSVVAHLRVLARIEG
jgi:acetoin utilization deacetylase AcuC-like enzyme